MRNSDKVKLSEILTCAGLSFTSTKQGIQLPDYDKDNTVFLNCDSEGALVAVIVRRTFQKDGK